MLRPTLLFTALLAMTPAGAALAQPSGPMPGMQGMGAMAGPIVTLSVTGTAEAAPDIAQIGTGVETRAMSAKEAMGQNAVQMDALVKALAKAGIDRKDIQTSGITLNPQYDYSNRKPGEPPVFQGYVASNRLSVTIRKVETAGAMVDTMVAAGATNISGPSFSIDDMAKLQDQARAKAMAIAAQRAAAYAAGTGFAKARLLAISEGSDIPPPMPMMAMREMKMSDASAPTTIEPGQLSASVTLSFRYMLEH